MKRELIGLGILLGAIALSESAFSRPQRRKIGEAYNWRCQWEEGCSRTFQAGWMIEINHEKPGVDNVKKAKPYCQEHHATWHERRGETKAAQAIRGRMRDTGGRTFKWLDKHKRP